LAFEVDLSGQINALVLENTFTSLPSLVPHALPALAPFSFLCHQKWDSASKIPLIPATTPILMLSGAKDEIVPKDHMRRLWEVVAKRGEKKKLNGSEYKTGLERAKYIEFENGSHSTFEFIFNLRLCFNL
jgi:abhydrolase domain-containing protein 13